MIIDLHAHYVPPVLAARLRERTGAPCIARLPGGDEVLQLPVGSLAFNAAYTDIDARVAFMDEQGVDMQILSFPGLFGADSLPVDEARPLVRLFNEAAADACRRFPRRFLGLAALPLADTQAAYADLEDCIGRLGLCGVILPINGFVSLEQARRLAPVLAFAHRMKLHVFIHPGRRPDEVPALSTGKTAPFSDSFLPRQALAVQSQVASALVTLAFTDFLAAYPDATFHVANLGGTLAMVVERMDHASRLRSPGDALPSARLRESRVHVDCSSLGPRALELAVAAFGADKIVLGTDCPIFSTEWTLDAVREARLSHAEREAILGANAARLLARHLRQ